MTLKKFILSKLPILLGLYCASALHLRQLKPAPASPSNANKSDQLLMSVNLTHFCAFFLGRMQL